jgi:hypothetical protein
VIDDAHVAAAASRLNGPLRLSAIRARVLVVLAALRAHLNGQRPAWPPTGDARPQLHILTVAFGMGG